LRERLRRILYNMEGLHALVVGDLYLDEYIVGRPSKISREAPVIVLDHVGSYSQPGGGAAPAVNVVALEGVAHVAGIVGNDHPGEELLNHLSAAGVDVSSAVVAPNRITTRKLRVVAQGSLRFPQQMLRVDFQDRTPVGGQVERQLLQRATGLMPQVQLVLISDYLSGVVTEGIARMIAKSAQTFGRVTAADSQGALSKYRGYNLVKCNRDEAASFLGRSLDRIQDCAAAAKELAAKLNLGFALITLGQEGVVLGQGNRSWHLPALKRIEVYDVTGAGDAVVTVAGMALAAGATPLEAAILANLAGGVAVQRWGNAPVTREDLDKAIERWDGEIIEDPDTV
jgi:rfaE bifunctional protein kinase chain/domain